MKDGDPEQSSEELTMRFRRAKACTCGHMQSEHEIRREQGEFSRCYICNCRLFDEYKSDDEEPTLKRRAARR